MRFCFEKIRNIKLQRRLWFYCCSKLREVYLNLLVLRSFSAGGLKMSVAVMTILAMIFPAPVLAQAAFKSASYVIYENIHHKFSGPTISGVNVTVSGITATATWNTNVVADSFVEYSTDASFTGSHEQGKSLKNATSHTVIVTGLAATTLYYYRVKSTRANGGTTISSSGTFTTGADPNAAEETPPAGGGGVIIVESNDQTPPGVSHVVLEVVDDNSVRITWDTDELSTSFIEYGTKASYGHTYGHWEYVMEHSVVLPNLKPATEYHFRVLSSDDFANVGYSQDKVFNTTEGITEEEPVDIDAAEEEGEGEDKGEEEGEFSLFEFFKQLIPNLTEEQMKDIKSLNDLSNLLPIPIFSRAPTVEVGATEAKIFWGTDRDANSIVAFAPLNAYRPGASEPYQQIVGNSEEYVSDHAVSLYNLSPDTEYHFQVRSKSRFGPTARSADLTFRTPLEELEITSYFVQIVDDQTAIFKWVTNKPSNSAVRFSPYQNNFVAVDQQKIIKDNAFSVIHEIKVTDFEGGVFYDVELVSSDDLGNTAMEVIERFSTSESDTPPVISHIKTDSTVFVDRSDKIQTIISWLTNEPATSRVFYQEGVYAGDAELKESTPLNKDYSKEHVVVISKFDPGRVYTFRVESIDSGGNATISSVHTFMTAKKKESIIQIIMNVLENTFGWLKKLFPQ